MSILDRFRRKRRTTCTVEHPSAVVLGTDASKAPPGSVFIEIPQVGPVATTEHMPQCATCRQRERDEPFEQFMHSVTLAAALTPPSN